ncbi:MAG: pilin [Candidatus Pacebacteria bacterium]|nr:pilin [Candidatus Paceibacterota bacterium]
MTKKVIIAFFFSIIISSAGIISKTLAASSSAVISNPLSVDTLPSLLCIIFDGLVYLGGPVLGLVILLAGISWLTSMGDPAKVKTAKSAITFAVIGLIVVLSSKAIYSFIIDALEINATKC